MTDLCRVETFSFRITFPKMVYTVSFDLDKNMAYCQKQKKNNYKLGNSGMVSEYRFTVKIIKG